MKILFISHAYIQQTKFGARCRAWNLAPYNHEAPPSIQLRLDDELNLPATMNDNFVISNKKDILGYDPDLEINRNYLFIGEIWHFDYSWFTRNLDVRVKDLSLDLSMSTVIGLSDLSEDEIIAKPLPMEILLMNLKVHLMEDRPPVNITSPGPVPINLEIGKMHIKRNENGVFEIQPPESDGIEAKLSKVLGISDEIAARKRERDRELISLQLVMQQLKLDNDSLKKQLLAADKTSEVNT